MIRLNDILRQEGLAPEDTAICLHSPSQKKLARLLPYFAEDEPRMLEVYQSGHSGPAAATLRRRRHMASFVRIAGGTLALAGVFRVERAREPVRDEIRALPEVERLIQEFGVYLELDQPGADLGTWFDLVRTDHLGAYKGRLQIKPLLTPAYMRLAESLDAEIVALSEASVLMPDAPGWTEFIVTGPEIRALPPSWAARLREWRGVYLIVDETDGARYVGSAYGEENLLSRWRTHVAGPRGVTAGLRDRNPMDFRFSILEVLNPTLDPKDVIAVEMSWMERLHTREFGLNEN